MKDNGSTPKLMQPLNPNPVSFHLKRTYWFSLVAITLLFAWNAFYQLSNMPLLSWDEARHGVSAKEMIISGNWLINTFDGEVDYYNLKPVLSFAPMIAGYEIFGFDALGLRFFSAFLTVITGLMVMLVSTKQMGPAKGLLAGLVLVLVERFFLVHNARTGDPDALYLFLYVGAVLLVFGDTKNSLNFSSAGFLAGLAFLTKSFHAIPLAISLVCLIILRFGIGRLFASRLVLCFVSGLVPVLLWGAARYQFDGLKFLWKMVEYDVLNRASSPIEGHAGDAYFYIRNLQQDFKFWLVAIMLLALPMIFVKRKPNRSEWHFKSLASNCNLQLILCIAINVLLFSTAKSKLDWYVYPAVPLLAMLLASWLVVLTLKNYTDHNRYVIAVWVLVALACIKMEFGIVRQLDKNLLDTEPVVLRIEEINKTAEMPMALYIVDRAWTQSEYLAAAHGDKVSLKSGGLTAYRTAAEPKLLLLD